MAAWTACMWVCMGMYGVAQTSKLALEQSYDYATVF